MYAMFVYCAMFVQHYVDALEYVQQWIVRRRAQSDSLGDFFRLQQKLFGNIAWCM